MKTHGLSVFLGALLLAAAALGQNNPAVVMADIPFAFVVANQTLPAGRYSVSNLGEKTLHIADSHNQGAYVLTYAVDGSSGATPATLVFHRYGDTYFLVQVWGTGGRQGKQLFASSSEKEWARKGISKEIAVLRTAQ